jgi:hypothetical protein
MARLIFHFGMNKTGSTAIQSSLAAGAGTGFLYPALGEPPYKPYHEDALDQIFSTRRLQLRPLKSDQSARLAAIAADGKEKIRQAAADARQLPVILSSEGAFRYLLDEDVAALRRFVEPLFDQVQLIAYVREPFGFISASFHNAIKGHGLATFELEYQPYRRFEKFDNVFGRNRVRLWKYDPRSFPDCDVVAHFCASLGLPRVASAAVNVTLCRPAVSAIYRLNRLAAEAGGNLPGLRAVRKTIKRDFPHQDWPKFRLSPAVIAPLIERHSKDIDWIEERIGCSLRHDYPSLDEDVTSEADLLHIAPDALEGLRAFADIIGGKQGNLLKQALIR